MGKILQWLGLQEPLPNYTPEQPEQTQLNQHDPETVRTLKSVLDEYDLVEVVQATNTHDAFMIVSERSNPLGYLARSSIPFENDGADFYRDIEAGPSPVGFSRTQGRVQLADSPNMREIGSSSPSPYTNFVGREYNQELQGNNGLEKYHKMRSDGVVSGTMLMFKTPVNSARWFMEPAEIDEKELAEKQSKFAWDCLTTYQSTTWTQIKNEAMLMCEYGYFILEKVWENRIIDGKKRTILKKLASRHPMDVKEWHFDKNGGPKGVTMFVANGDDVEERFIPIKKLLVFTYGLEGDIRGRSALRAAYKHSYYKEQFYKIDAIQKERHGIGIPVIKLPPSFDDNDKLAANELGRNLRTNERAHVVLPPYWEMFFAKLEGQPVSAIDSIVMHDKAIRENVLASFLGSDTNTKEEDLTLFLKATRFVADSICDAINTYLIPELIDYNFEDVERYPKLKVRRIGEQADWRVLSFAVRNFVGSGIIRPDDRLETNMREELDLPRADITTTRVVAAPQAGAAPPTTMPNATPGKSAPTAPSGKTDGTPDKPGLPRQTPVATAKVPGAGSGNDKGGQS